MVDSRMTHSVVVLALFAGAGCSSGDISSNPVRGLFGDQKITSSVLKERLDQFETRFTWMVEQCSEDIVQGVNDNRRARNAVQWKIRSVAAMNAALDRKEPLAALLDAWALCVQMTRYFSDGFGKEEFGDRADEALKMSRAAVTDVRAIGTGFLSDKLDDKQVASAVEDVVEWADDHPIGHGFSRTAMWTYSTSMSQAGNFGWIRDISLDPFGLGGAVSAAEEVAEVGRHIADVVEQLPVKTRWQVELLLYEIDNQETVEVVRQGILDITSDTTRLLDLLEKMPVQLREQVTLVLDDIDSRQENLRETLREADATLEKLRPVLVDATGTGNAFDRAAESFTSAGKAWEATAAAIDEHLISRFDSDDSEKTSVPKATDSSSEDSGFEITQYQDAADALANAAKELLALCEEIDRLSSPERVDQTVVPLRDTANAAAIDMREQAVVVTDHIFTRSWQLLLIALGLVFAYRLLFGRRAPR